MKDLATDNLDNMTPAEFEEYLPELFEASGGSISNDPRLANFLKANPDCAALVSDLETIAEQAKSLFEPLHEPSDNVWSNIASKLKEEPQSDEDN
jgi:tryptophan 2,3-dioxygenase